MTAEEMFALPHVERMDGRLLAGRFVERPHPFRSPAHASTVANLCAILGNWEARVGKPNWRVYGYGCPYRLRSNPDTVLCFDASVCTAALAQSTDVRADFLDGRPALVVEVLDLGETYEQMREVVDAALDAGVRQVWIVDPVAELIGVYQITGEPPHCYFTGGTLTGGDALPGFSCAVADIFE